MKATNKKKFAGSKVRKFLKACGLGNLKQVRQLLAEGHDPNRHADTLGDRPLHYAAGSGQISVARLLIQKGADVNARMGYGGKDRPVDTAAERKQLKMVKFLIEQGALLDLQDSSPALLHATRNKDGRMIQLLLQNGARVDESSLAWATRTGDMQLLNAFEKAGADIAGIVKSNPTRLPFAAANSGSVEMLKLIRQWGGDLKVTKADDGDTLLHRVKSDSAAVYLIEIGCDIHATNKNSLWTPLHHCADEGFLDATKLLLERGADPRVKSATGFTPRMVAQGKHQPVYELLTEWQKTHSPRKVDSQLKPTKPRPIGKKPAGSNKSLLPVAFLVSPPNDNYLLGCRAFVELIEKSTPEWATFAVRSPVEAVLAAGVPFWPKRGWHRNVAVRLAKETDASFNAICVIEISENPWTIVFLSLWSNHGSEQAYEYAQVFSEQLKSTCITFCQADTAGVQALSVFHEGVTVESIEWNKNKIEHFSSQVRPRGEVKKISASALGDHLLQSFGVLVPAGYPSEEGTRGIVFASTQTFTQLLKRVDILVT